jgi:hypothetical protein
MWVDVKVGDFNGDGKADIVGRWREGGQWWMAQSTGSAFISSLWTTWSTATAWANVGVGDIDGNGLPDIIGRSTQNGQWWAGLSTSSNFTTQFWTTWSL